MRFADRLSLSMRMFTNRPRRTFLTILGVSVGIGAVLFLVSLGNGLQQVIIGQITTADSLLSLDVTTGSSGLLNLETESVENIKKIPNVVEIARNKNLTGQLNRDDLTTDAAIRAVDPAFFRLNGLTATAGTLFDDPSVKSAVLSIAAVKLLGLEPSRALGERVTVTVYVPKPNSETDEIEVVTLPDTYTIVGTIDDDTVGYAYVPLGTLVPAGVTSYDLLKVKVASKETANSVRDAIVGQGFVVSALSDVIDQANQIFRIVQIVLGLFGLIALVVSAIGMFNTMTIALLERTNEIGIMRSVGVTQKDVQGLFITEAMMMGFLGGVFGVGLGVLGGVLANIGFNLLASRLGGRAFDLFVEPLWFVAVIIIFSTLIGFLTGVFPARRAANMDPLEALRYK